MLWIARTVTITLLIWVVAFITFGGSRSGRDFFASLVASSFSENPKGGLPLMMLAIPVLIAGSVCSLFVVRTSGICQSCSNDWAIRWLPKFLQRRFLRLRNNDGDGNFDQYAILFLVIPCTVYFVTSIFRHLENRGTKLLDIPHHYAVMDDEASLVTKEVGNTFGMMAMSALPFFLIPVSRHGPILRLFGWSHARAVKLHIYCGRIIVFGSFFHGFLHIIRWKVFFGEDIKPILLPPKQCWPTQLISHKDDNDADDSYSPQCKSEDHSCTCYDHFLYLTGVVGCLGLFILVVTSFDFVRRKCYRLFYISHILAAPIFLLGATMHYNRGIIYIAPSILYYIATSLPIFQERPKAGTKITSVEASKDGAFVSLTMEATPEAMMAYQPGGSYVQLLAPTISAVSHPFTINKIPRQENQLRIIFRATGKFTKDLSMQLRKSAMEGSSTPLLHVDGYHGTPDRMSQLLQHEVVVLVAGGIGITPFLSLLTDLVTPTHSGTEKCIGNDGRCENIRVRKVVLHWMCRDPALINYIRNEYFEPLVQQASSCGCRCQVDIIIHQTGKCLTPSSPHEMEDLESQPTMNQIILAEPSNDVESDAKPFYVSKFSVGTKTDWRDNMTAFLTFSSITWIGMTLVWYVYLHIQREEDVCRRLVAPLAIGLLAFAVSKMVSRLRNFEVATEVKNNIKACNGANKFDQPNETSLLFPRNDSDATTVSKSSSLDEENSPYVALSTEHGRPNLHTVLADLDSFDNAGVFTCGPTVLIQSIQDIVEEKRSLETESMDSHVQKQCITMYDEVFLM